MQAKLTDSGKAAIITWTQPDVKSS